MNGVEAAKAAGIKVKINTVVMKGVNHHEINDLVEWCGRHGFDIAFIEVMPMGDIGHARSHRILHHACHPHTPARPAVHIPIFRADHHSQLNVTFPIGRGATE